jgi:hypothetical protein
MEYDYYYNQREADAVDNNGCYPVLRRGGG